ncbi:MAG: PAS domain S-box protein [Nitrospirota bacterium]
MTLFSFKSIRSKLVFAGAVISILIILLFYTSYRFTHHIKGEATRINLTGGLRYRIFEMTWLSQRIAEREITKDRGLRESAKAALKDEIAEFDEVVSYIKHGNEELEIRPLGHHSEEILPPFNSLMDEWAKNFKPVFLKISELSEDTTEDEAREILSPVDLRVHEYVYEINNIAQFLTDHSKKEIDKYDRLRFYVLAIFLLSAALIIFFVSRSVLRPLSRLKKASEKIQAGRFDARADVKSTDEIGMFAGSFNKMAESINTVFENLSERNKELDVINRISSVVGRSLSVEEIANAALDEILNLENLRIEKKGAIFVADNKKKILNLIAYRGFTEEFAKAEAAVPFGDCLCGIAAETGREIVSGDCFTDVRHTRKYSEMTEHGHINLPLKSRDRVIGVLCLYLPAHIKLPDEEISLCRSIADIIAISLQNAINHRQVAMLAQSLDSSMDLIIITDADARIIHINPQGAKNLGYTQDEIIGEKVFILLSPRNPAGISKEIYEDTLKGGWQGELINIRKDGSEYPVFLTTSPVKDENGNVISHVGIARDITEWKQAENALRQSEASLREAQRIARLGNWGWDISSDKAYCSEEVDRIFGYERGKFGRNYDALMKTVHPDDKELVEKKMREAVQNGTPFDFDRRVVRPDGTVRMVHEHGEVVRDKTGKPVRLFGTIQDITERKKAEEKIKKHSEEVMALAEASNVMLASAVSITENFYETVCYIAVKKFGLKISWLALIEKNGGIKPVAEADSGGGYLTSLNIDLDDPLYERCPIVAAVKTMTPQVLNDLIEDPCPGPCGGKMALSRGCKSLMTAPLISTNGELIGIIGFYSIELGFFTPEKLKLLNVYSNQAASLLENRFLIEGLEEKVKERTSELEIAKLQAESANRAKSDFLANMSHELRTPLNAIIGFSEIMRDGMTGDVADEQKEYLNDIWESGKHLLRLINDILDLSKVEAGKMKLELSECHVGETVRSCLLFFKEKSIKHNIKLSVDVSEDTGSVMADEQKIKQVILNLLGNAFKFTPDGGSVRVQALLTRDEGRETRDEGRGKRGEKASIVLASDRPSSILISVADTGIGIAPENMEKLFQPFQQIESTLTKKYEGTGLGLSLCKNFVELHGGRIWVESEVGKGSKFIFTIPVKQG